MMLLIRRFEERAGEAYSIGQIGGFCHLYIGQEAVAVGTISALRADDYVISAYREHGQALARGMTSRSIMAELFGKATGCSGGKGGSMHLFDASLGFMGGHGIVGGQIPSARASPGPRSIARPIRSHSPTLAKPRPTSARSTKR
jgi:pyruvate dehydrogenase E1 component alpha subunit